MHRLLIVLLMRLRRMLLVHLSMFRLTTVIVLNLVGSVALIVLILCVIWRVLVHVDELLVDVREDALDDSTVSVF